MSVREVRGCVWPHPLFLLCFLDLRENVRCPGRQSGCARAHIQFMHTLKGARGGGAGGVQREVGIHRGLQTGKNRGVHLPGSYVLYLRLFGNTV